MKKNTAFTLIEVLLALAIIAIALTALLKATSQNVAFTDRIKEKNTRHWVAMQGVHMIQLGLLPVYAKEEVTQVTTMFHEPWYWRAKLTASPIKHMDQIQITTSKHETGPFEYPLIAFRYAP